MITKYGKYKIGQAGKDRFYSQLESKEIKKIIKIFEKAKIGLDKRD